MGVVRDRYSNLLVSDLKVCNKPKLFDVFKDYSNKLLRYIMMR